MARLERGKGMLLTRAQLLCAWAVAAETPISAEFEMVPPDNNGAVILIATSEYGQRTYKLPREGGRELISEQGTVQPELTGDAVS